MLKLIYFLLLIYFFMIPLDGIVAFLSLKTGIEIILGWEILLSIMLFYLTIVLYLERGKIVKINLLSTKDILILVFYLLFISIPLGIYNQGFRQTLWGIKLILPPIIILYLLFLISPSLFKEFVEKVMKMYFLLFVPIFVVGILENIYGTSFLTDVLGMPYGGGPFVKISQMEGIYRTIATFREPYDFGFFSFIVSLFALCRFVKLKEGKIWSFIFLILGFSGLLLSTSRINIFSLAYSFVLLFFIFWFIENFVSNKNKKAKIFIIFFISIVIISLIFLPYIHNIFSQSELALFSMRSLLERKYVWSSALNSFPINDAFHFLFGYGIGAIGTAQLKINPYVYNPVDNMYIHSLINFGLIGTILLVRLMFISIVKLFLKTKRLDWIQLGFILIIDSMIFIQGFFANYAEGLLSWGIFCLGILYLKNSYINDNRDNFRQN